MRCRTNRGFPICRCSDPRKGRPHRSLRTRSMRTEMEKRRRSLMSEPGEALEVAREIEALVSLEVLHISEKSKAERSSRLFLSQRMMNIAETLNFSRKI